ncbi:MAG: condensin subunit MukF [Polyangiaceae bacterium]|nr:condensin subunit MukF [Polyangiaceae bacterium]MBK8942478.1 condensin subunit MukF [Polyangiaceae bacterium]
MTTDPNRVLAYLARERPSLELSTVDLCFVAALHLRANVTSTSSFQEDQLVDVFEEVVRVLEPTGEPQGKRASAAIRRLREQRLLARVDGAGVVRAGEFALTRLAAAIVEFFLEEESLTRETLAVLMRTLLTSLADIAAAAASAQTPEDWRLGVATPLRVIIGDLAGGVERRQRGFDLHQVELQKEIGALLGAEWFGAIERSQALLETTSATLRELNQVLMKDTQEAHARLQDVLDRAAAVEPGEVDDGAREGIAEAESAVKEAGDQLDRIAAWGSARQRAWSDHYQYVHRYLRDVVRLDPSRMLTQRLRDQLTGKSGRPFALTIAAAPAIRLLRPLVTPPEERPPVRRPRKEREAEPAVVAALDAQAVLTEKVRAALSEGASTLRDVTDRLTSNLPESERFLAAGRVAETVAALCRPDAGAERPWVPLSAGIAIEEWSVPGSGKGSAA